MSEQITPDVPAAEESDSAPGDQTPQQKAMTDLLGLFQTSAESQNWVVDVVSSDATSVVLGLTSRDGDNYSLSMNPTP